MLQRILHRHQLMQANMRKRFIRNPIHQRVHDGLVQMYPTTVHRTNFAQDLLHHIQLELRGRCCCLFSLFPPVMEYYLAVAEGEAVFSHELFRYSNGLLLFSCCFFAGVLMYSSIMCSALASHKTYINLYMKWYNSHPLTLIVGLCASKMYADFLLIIARTHPNAIWKHDTKM